MRGGLMKGGLMKGGLFKKSSLLSVLKGDGLSAFWSPFQLPGFSGVIQTARRVTAGDEIDIVSYGATNPVEYNGITTPALLYPAETFFSVEITDQAGSGNALSKITAPDQPGCVWPSDGGSGYLPPVLSFDGTEFLTAASNVSLDSTAGWTIIIRFTHDDGNSRILTGDDTQNAGRITLDPPNNRIRCLSGTGSLCDITPYSNSSAFRTLIIRTGDGTTQVTLDGTSLTPSALFGSFNINALGAGFGSTLFRHLGKIAYLAVFNRKLTAETAAARAGEINFLWA